MLIDNITDDFFNEDVAVEATYYPGDGLPSVSTMVILNRDYIDGNQFGDSRVETKRIEALGKSSVFSNAKQGEYLIINSVTYYIINPQPSEGVTNLILSLNNV